MLNQGLFAITFFKASAFLILLVVFLLLYRDFPSRFLRTWLAGWVFLTLYAAGQVMRVMTASWEGRFIRVECSLLAGTIFLASVWTLVGRRVNWSVLGPLLGVAAVWAGYTEHLAEGGPYTITWVTALLEAVLSLVAGWALWRYAGSRMGLGPRLLAATFLLDGLHNLDRPLWVASRFFQLRIALGDLFEVAMGTAMAVVILEAARTHKEELNAKLRRLALITAAATQEFDLGQVLRVALQHLLETLNATHALVRLLEGTGEKQELVARSAIGFSEGFLQRAARISAAEPWAKMVLRHDVPYVCHVHQASPEIRRRMLDEKITALIEVRLPGKEGPLGILAVASNSRPSFPEDEVRFLLNAANLLGLTIQNVGLFEQVAHARQQWASTFDSIEDPILVHDPAGLILRGNQSFAEKLGKAPQELVQRPLRELIRQEAHSSGNCPYCEGILGRGDQPDPNLAGGYYLATNSTIHGPAGEVLGTVHLLRDITERKQAEERYRTLIENLQEGVFISTPDGRFVDFNDAFMHMLGYDRREELLGVDISSMIYVNPADRGRLKKLLREHGSVNNFEFQMRRRDGEVLTVLESSIATQNAAGVMTAYQGFVLDITERKRAEQEIHRRNRELMVLNSIGQTLSQSFELGELLGRALRQVVELFGLDMAAIYLLDQDSGIARRVAAIGQRSEFARHFPPTPVPAELIEHVRQVRATVLSGPSLPLPPIFAELQRKESVVVSHLIVLWAKDRLLGVLAVGCRTFREFSAAELNLLNAVGNQIAASIEKSLLLEETQHAYENLRRTQEQLLQSAKMAAVGQLISGVAHELNNPLTAILGYSQLLSASDPASPHTAPYLEKLYRQAQRTQRIVQNLLSFARQQKPERRPVHLNKVLEDSLTLREYDLRINNIQVHRDFASDLPLTAGDPHQLQQVFLNIINNAVDAVLENSNRGGQIWLRSRAEDGWLLVEITDNGPGVKEASRVFDPFYTTKAVGKGTGLGLSICYGIIHEHDGEITVRNSPPRGATFCLRLPVMPVEATRRDLRTAPVEVPQKLRILLVDDEPAILELEQEILKDRCAWVKAVQSGSEAIQVLEHEAVDLVVTDLKMPGEMTGSELYEWIVRVRPELTGRVIFTMSDAGTDDVAALLAQSGCPHIQKPFPVERFLEVIRQTLEQPAAPTLRR